MQMFKSVEDELRVPNVFLFGGQSNYYGEIAQIVDAQSLNVNGRVNSKYKMTLILWLLKVYKCILALSFILCGPRTKF